jgi:hypothetical protein
MTTGNGQLSGMTSLVKAPSPSTSSCFGFSTSVYCDGPRTGLYSYVQPNTLSPRAGVGYGVRSQVSFGAADYAIHGLALSSDEGCGVYGQSQLALSLGIGVYGYANDNSASAYGVYGSSNSNESSAFGVYGRAQGNAGNGYGVYGSVAGNSGSNWAGYFSGDVNVTGTIFTPAKMSRLDHPADPENKYLVHSSIESSEMINTYSGNVILDESGAATVALPDWFELINTDYRYSLTCIGGFAPVFVAEEVANRRFKIAGGGPGMKVSWQITARRADQFARAFPMAVEVDKRPDERGKYLHPTAFGLDESQGVDYQSNRAVGESAGER